MSLRRFCVSIKHLLKIKPCPPWQIECVSKHIMLSFVYTSALLTHCAIRVRCISGVQLINFLRTWGEQRIPGAWRRIQFSSCLRKKPINFSSQRTVYKPFADGAAQVRSPIHTYTHLVCERFANHLVRSCIRGLTWTCRKHFVWTSKSRATSNMSNDWSTDFVWTSKSRATSNMSNDWSTIYHKPNLVGFLANTKGIHDDVWTECFLSTLFINYRWRRKLTQ